MLQVLSTEFMIPISAPIDPEPTFHVPLHFTFDSARTNYKNPEPLSALCPYDIYACFYPSYIPRNWPMYVTPITSRL